MATARELKQSIENGAWDAALEKLYGSRAGMLDSQRARYAGAVEEFAAMYGADRAVEIYSAPGRTEIGGNHTDHNHGKVMAGAVDLDVIAVVSKNGENIVRVKSMGFDKRDEVELSNLLPVLEEAEHSQSLIRGVAAGIAKQGGKVGGFDAYTTSQVLRGSGLSSSAAFEVVIGAVFNGEYNEGRFSAVEIAKIGQYAENEYFGKPSGLLDQTACSVGSVITIDFCDPANPVVEKVSFDLEKHGYCLCITDTKGSHASLTGEYAAVRKEMEAVAACFGKAVLRDVDEDAFLADIAGVRAKLGDRAVLRALHFFADSRRAGAMCEAIRADRFEEFLRLVTESGHSSYECVQNAYSIKNPQEQGVPLGLALSQRMLNGCGAWRLHGGGFAGTIQAFVPVRLLDEYRAAMDGVFGAGSCYVLNVRNYGGIRVTPSL